MLTIFTDGSCVRGNPGDSGAAYVIMRDGKLLEGLGFPVGKGTNNRGELQAAIRGLEQASNWLQPNEDILLVSDSQYMLAGLQETSKRMRKGCPNNDQWAELHKILLWCRYMKSTVLLYWVRGHSDTNGNQLCDRLANHAATYNKVYRPKQKGAK